jgi:hypothetical protein
MKKNYDDELHNLDHEIILFYLFFLRNKNPKANSEDIYN